MREIKFRVWDKDEKIFLTNTECDFFTLNDMKYDDPNLFMQFTGLKDKNGVEIYEGDLLNFGGKTNVPVIFENGAFTIWEEPLGWDYDSETLLRVFDTTIRAEIVGNIYQNPELL